MAHENDRVQSGDKSLGMDRSITRRDFLNGMAIGAGGILASGWLSGFDVEALAQFA
jgi:hypothetical protein